MTRSRKRRASKSKKLNGRISQLESDLRKSVSKIQLKNIESNLQNQIVKVQKKLAESVPKARLDAARKNLHERILDLELKLKESGKEAELLGSRISEMQLKLTRSPVIAATMENLTRTQLQLKSEVQKLKDELTHSTTAGAVLALERKITELTAELLEKIGRLQADVASSIARTGSGSLHANMDQLQSKIVELESKFAAAVLKSEVDELKARLAQLEEELGAASRRIKALEPQRETKPS